MFPQYTHTMSVVAHALPNLPSSFQPVPRTSAAAIHGQALDGEPTSLDTNTAEGSGGTSPDTVTLGRLVAGAEWRQPLAANWSGTAGTSTLVKRRGGRVGGGSLSVLLRHYTHVELLVPNSGSTQVG